MTSLQIKRLVTALRLIDLEPEEARTLVQFAKRWLLDGRDPIGPSGETAASGETGRVIQFPFATRLEEEEIQAGKPSTQDSR